MNISILQATTQTAQEFYAKSPLNDFLTQYEIDLLTGNVIIGALAIAVTMFIAYEFTRDAFIAMFCTTVIVCVLALLSVLPLWIVLLLAIVMGAYIIIRGI